MDLARHDIWVDACQCVVPLYVYARLTVNESVVLITLIFDGSLNEKNRQRPCGRRKLF